MVGVESHGGRWWGKSGFIYSFNKDNIRYVDVVWSPALC